MPVTSFAMSYLFGLARNGTAGEKELAKHCDRASIDVDEIIKEMRSTPDILQLVKNRNIDDDVYPLSIQLLKDFCSSDFFESVVAPKMTLGSEAMKDIGNVYCAALPAWIAAGLEDALAQKKDITGEQILAVGYGSGDAAEAIPMVVMRGWKKATAQIGFNRSLQPQQNLTQMQYESLHDTGDAQGLKSPDEGFVVDSIGSSEHPGFSDEGIEYYRFVR